MRGGGQQGESNYNSCHVIRGPSFGGVGWRTLIVGPHTTVVDDDDDGNHHHGRKALVHPVLLDAARHCQCCQPQSTAEARGHSGRGVHLVVEEEVRAVALILQVLIQPGVDDGGKERGVV